MITSEIYSDIRKLRLELRIKKYQSEIDIISEENAPWNKERLVLLQKAIDELNEEKKEKSNKVSFNEIENHMFKKPWKSLPEVHKIMKIREFVNSNIKSKRKKLEKELVNGLRNNKLKNNIEYDINKGQIINIKCLNINDKKTYQLDL